MSADLLAFVDMGMGIVVGAAITWFALTHWYSPEANAAVAQEEEE